MTIPGRQSARDVYPWSKESPQIPFETTVMPGMAGEEVRHDIAQTAFIRPALHKMANKRC
jgi:hypothetical protein